MIQNLHEVAQRAKRRYQEDFSAKEVVLSENFKHAYGACLRRSGQNIDYTAHTAMITTAGNLNIYIPNQWFVAAAYTVPFIQTFLRYKELVDFVLAHEFSTPAEKKNYVRTLKESDDAADGELFRVKAHAHLTGRIPADEMVETVHYLTRFITDYDWWYGSKTIDRGDAYVSPVLSLLGVVNASQGYIADISYYFATEGTLRSLAAEMVDDNAAQVDAAPVANPVAGQTVPRLTGGINEIVYGAPGTGKSKYLDDTYANTTIATRVVFHPEYSYFDFVGVYKPFPVYKETATPLRALHGAEISQGEPCIDYRFVPGPFIKCLTAAYLNPANMHTLIIEEINRANAASVFGEIFQLLDRDLNGQSEYSIAPPDDLYHYLLSIDGLAAFVQNGIQIPSNMNIVASMNSADQGVQPMDSAFKRRWNFKYTRINIEGAVHERAALRYAGRAVFWGQLVFSINQKLIGLGFDEDRFIGPYFIKPDELGRRQATDKLLLYLWDDVLRHRRDAFFNNQIHTFSELSDRFEAEDVFNLLHMLPAENAVEAAVDGSEESPDEPNDLD